LPSDRAGGTGHADPDIRMPIGIDLVRVDRLELAFTPRAWPFADERRAAIDAYFAELQRQKPALWNGRVLVLCEHALADGVFRGSFLATDYASFLAWRDWDFPDRAMRNCFALAVLRAADGAFLLGVMNAHTANAGRVYFPGGTPDPDDVVDGRVDLLRSIGRELKEETGLDLAHLDVEAGWYGVFAGARIALLKIARVREDAAALRARILAHLARQPQPELADIRIVRGPADLTPAMPPFVGAFLARIWG
jgi:8-oxo-dGTP pyrophosphatase MutT (NUDIX family)